MDINPLPVSLYCVWQWWEQHCQVDRGRPERIDFDRALENEVNDLALWDVDPAVTPAQLGNFLQELALHAGRHDRNPRFSFIPITWEEMDWEFPRFHRPSGGIS
jgi:hypothetical protein